MSSEAALRVDGLTAGYGSFNVVRALDLEVGSGEIVGLAGRNGAGKTTALKAISGMLRRRAGRIWLAGKQLPQSPERVARAGLIQVPEGRLLMPGLTVSENLRLAVAAVGLRWSADAVDDILVDFPEVKPLLGRRAGLLSGGEQQLVALARGLMARPKVLMIDELSLGLSPAATHRSFDALGTAVRRRDVSAIVVDQDVRRLGSLCDSLYVLRDGAAVRWALTDIQGALAEVALN